MTARHWEGHGADPLTQLTALRGYSDFWPLELPEDLEDAEVRQGNLVTGLRVEADALETLMGACLSMSASPGLWVRAGGHSTGGATAGSPARVPCGVRRGGMFYGRAGHGAKVRRPKAGPEVDRA